MRHNLTRAAGAALAGLMLVPLGAMPTMAFAADTTDVSIVSEDDTTTDQPSDDNTSVDDNDKTDDGTPTDDNSSTDDNGKTDSTTDDSGSTTDDDSPTTNGPSTDTDIYSDSTDPSVAGNQAAGDGTGDDYSAKNATANLNTGIAGIAGVAAAAAVASGALAVRNYNKNKEDSHE